MGEIRRDRLDERLREPRGSRDLRHWEKPSEWIARVLKEACDVES